MALTVTLDSPRVQRISRDYGMMTGTIAFDASYPTGGESLSGISGYFSTMLAISFEGEGGYTYAYDKTNNKVLVYLSSGTPTLSAETSHTHAIALDGGATGAEASHTHAVALDGGATAAGSSHTHSVTAAAVDAEAAHTHAIALDGGATAAGASHTHGLTTGTVGAGTSHNHAFTGTAITPQAINVTHDAAANVTGVAVYLHTKDGSHGWLEFVSPTNADGTVRLNATGDYVLVFDSDTAATDGVAIYFDEDAATADARLLAVTPLASVDVLVPTSAGNMIRIAYNADPDTPGNQVYLDEDAANNYARLLFISPTTTSGTANTDDTIRGWTPVCAGANAAENAHTHALDALTLAGEATHTHGAGSLVDAASGVGSSHTHGLTTAAIGAEAAHTHAWGTLSDAASGVGASHTHSYGNLTETASAGGSSHTHTATAEVGDQVASEANLSGVTALQFIAFGLL